MSAKEERALHLELHRMNRVNGEMAARNAALESECARLRMGLKHDHEKLVTSHDALLQKCKDVQAAEHDRLARLQMERQTMFATMQREQDEMISRLQQEMQQKSREQRQTALNEIIVMKQNLEAHYADMIGKKTQELDAVKKSLADEMAFDKRARIQREEECINVITAMKQNLEAHYADIIGKKTQELDAVKKSLEDELISEKKACIRREEEHVNEITTTKQNLEAHYVDIIGKKTQQLDALKKSLEDKLISEKKACIQREEEQKQKLEAQYVDIIGKKTQQLDALKKSLEDELISEKKARIQREEEQKQKLDAKMQEWEENKRILQRIQVETQLELEKNERAHVETQLNRYMSIANEQKRQMEKEQNELAVVTEKRVEDRINALTLQLIKTVSFSHISCAIAANHAHAQLIYNLGFRDKRVLIYSHYSDRDEVESYNYLTLQHMEDRFDYVIVLTNCANKWDLPNSNYNKFHVLGYNFKSDFRNYAMFIMQTEKTLVHASQLCLMNDSFVIVDVLAYDRCMKHLFEPAVAHDFVGITSSHEGVYHLQSYFMCFKTKDVIKAVIKYFDLHGLPINHNESISVYELGITQYIMNQGFTPYAMVSNAEMQFPLNTTYCKWSAVLQHAGIIKRQHLLKQYPMRFAMTEYNIALIANKFSENTHFIHYLKYHGINLD